MRCIISEMLVQYRQIDINFSGRAIHIILFIVECDLYLKKNCLSQMYSQQRKYNVVTSRDKKNVCLYVHRSNELKDTPFSPGGIVYRSPISAKIEIVAIHLCKK